MENVEIWQNLEKQRKTDYDFYPPFYMWAEMKIKIRRLLMMEIARRILLSEP